MHPPSFLVLLIALLISATPLQARQADLFSVQGQVTDETTGAPLPGAFVFIAGSTHGSTTDTAGRYTLTGPFPWLAFEVVATRDGYASRVLQLDREDPAREALDFKLPSFPPPVASGDNPVASGDNKERKDHLRRLEDLLFSTTDNGRDCKLLNPEVLVLTYNEKTDILTATAHTPLKVQNEALGYEVTLYDFTLSGKQLQLNWSAYRHYAPMEPKNGRQQRKWDKNRLLTYQGSVRHFLTSLVNGTLQKEDFEAFQVDRPGMTEGKVTLEWLVNNQGPILQKDEEAPVWTMQFDLALLVIYDKPEPRRYREYQDKHGLQEWSSYEMQIGQLRPGTERVSWLSLNEGGITIDRMGYEYGDYKLTRLGLWGWERLGEMLPDDYQPD